MNKCNKGMGGTDMPCKWLKDFNPPIQPIDVFGSGHRPDSEPMKWISKAVTAKTKTADKKVRTWTILGQRDGSKGAFGIFDETEDFESDFPRYSAAYYPKATFKEVIAHYKGIPTDHVIALGDVEYFDITDEIQLGIWKECFNYHQENRYQ